MRRLSSMKIMASKVTPSAMASNELNHPTDKVANPRSSARSSSAGLIANGPEPVGYDPAMIPGWENSESPGFAGLKLEPWRLRVMPAAAMLTGEGIKVWQDRG